MSARISWTVISSATMDTTVATGTRRPLMQGIPPMTAGSTVIRVNATATGYPGTPNTTGGITSQPLVSNR